MKLPEFEYHMTGLLKGFFEYWRDQNIDEMAQEEWEDQISAYFEQIFNDEVGQDEEDPI